MLAGRDVFAASGVLQQLALHLTDAAPHIRDVAPGPIPAELAELVMECLAKKADERPRSMRVVLQRLDATKLAELWTRERAEAFWAAPMRVEGASELAMASTMAANHDHG